MKIKVILNENFFLSFLKIKVYYYDSLKFNFSTLNYYFQIIYDKSD
jgi:hypothetical protein